MTKTLSAAAAALLAGLAHAHEGHGLPGASHWHASDALGPLLAAGVAAGLWWFFRRK